MNEQVAFRTHLATLEGRPVTVEATFTPVTRTLKDGTVLTLVQDVVVFPRLTEAHLWISLNDATRRRLQIGQRFSFRAEVRRYCRANGTEDVGLQHIHVIKG